MRHIHGVVATTFLIFEASSSVKRLYTCKDQKRICEMKIAIVIRVVDSG